MIPHWNAKGHLPPVWPGETGTNENRSPYTSTLETMVQRFSGSPARRQILRGFIEFRSALYRVGILNGFQWCNGSFMEDVEATQMRSPNDIDVVTYFVLPPQMTQQSLYSMSPELFDAHQTKLRYSVDAYMVVLGQPMKADSVSRVAYWYSIWSHTRADEWKGFVNIALDPSDDHAALAVLDKIDRLEQNK